MLELEPEDDEARNMQGYYDADSYPVEDTDDESEAEANPGCERCGSPNLVYQGPLDLVDKETGYRDICYVYVCNDCGERNYVD